MVAKYPIGLLLVRVFMKIVPVIKSVDLEDLYGFTREFSTSSTSGPGRKIARWPTESLT